jgi:hypothetical protein
MSPPDVIPGRESMSLERLYGEIIRKGREQYGAPKSTCDATLWELRTYGLPQLAKPDCRRRLANLSTGQLRELLAALIRLRPEYPNITDELIAKIGGQL